MICVKRARAGVRQPMPTLAIILTFALGIGVQPRSSAVVNAALFRPLPYANSDRLVMVWGNFFKAQEGADAGQTG